MELKLTKNSYSMSVHEFIFFSLQSGDLDKAGGYFSQKNAELGKAIQKRLQENCPDTYRCEVPLNYRYEGKDFTLEIDGRADGMDTSTSLTMIEEIKSVSPYAFTQKPSPYFWAQLYLYGWFYCKENKASEVLLRLTVCNRETMKTKVFEETKSAGGLLRFFNDCIQKITPKIVLFEERKRHAEGTVIFPYAHLRDGQEKLIRSVRKAVINGRRLFACVPTGLGKTIGTIYAATTLLKERKIDRIFYLTAKNATGREAVSAIEALNNKGANLHAVCLCAKEVACQNDMAKADPLGVNGHCTGELCPYAKDYYSKVDGLITELYHRQNVVTQKQLIEFCRSNGICPHEFALDYSVNCDVVVMDYNYAFDPSVHLERYFGENAINERQVLLIDEAHNLLDRTCAMYTSEADNERLDYLLQMTDDAKTRRAIKDIGQAFDRLKGLCKDNRTTDLNGTVYGYYADKSPCTDFMTILEKELPALEKTFLLKKEPDAVGAKYVLSLKRFVNATSWYDGRFSTFVSQTDDRVSVKLICMDPSEILKRLFSRVESAVLFSATLHPKDYYLDLLGGEKNADWLSLPSPFSQSNLCIMRCPFVNTATEKRRDSLKALVATIAASVSAKKGNYVVFFPSYDYMESAFNAFLQKYPGVECFKQNRNMSYKDKEAFLGQFVADGQRRVAFCVLGGSFSEGIDLPGDRLIGVIIVGTGMPGLSSERNLLMEYYESTRERGFDYAYVYPGFNRVLQAGGRVIRRDNDQGVIVLIDSRYDDARILSLFPSHWKSNVKADNPSEVQYLLTEFWNQLKESQSL